MVNGKWLMQDTAVGRKQASFWLVPRALP